jgi:hypothetical protein
VLDVCRRYQPRAGPWQKARWGRDRSGSGVEMQCGLVVESVHEVSVAVHGDGDRTVAETCLDGLGVFAVGDEPRGVVSRRSGSGWRDREQRTRSRELSPIQDARSASGRSEERH